MSQIGKTTDISRRERWAYTLVFLSIDCASGTACYVCFVFIYNFVNIIFLMFVNHERILLSKLFADNDD